MFKLQLIEQKRWSAFDGIATTLSHEGSRQVRRRNVAETVRKTMQRQVLRRNSKLQKEFAVVKLRLEEETHRNDF